MIVVYALMRSDLQPKKEFTIKWGYKTIGITVRSDLKWIILFVLIFGKIINEFENHRLFYQLLSWLNSIFHRLTFFKANTIEVVVFLPCTTMSLKKFYTMRDQKKNYIAREIELKRYFTFNGWRLCSFVNEEKIGIEIAVRWQ